MKSLNQFLAESSLSRIYQKTKDYDVGAITAFRGDFTRSQNRDRNKHLMAYFLVRGYSITKVKGSYIENKGSSQEREVGEESFFIADFQKRGTLKDDLIKMGRQYDQDSILWVQNGKAGVLIGTSKRDNAFPDYGQSVTVGYPVFGDTEGEFFSRVGGRKFAFTEGVEIELPKTLNGLRAMKILAESVERGLVP